MILQEIADPSFQPENPGARLSRPRGRLPGEPGQGGAGGFRRFARGFSEARGRSPPRPFYGTPAGVSAPSGRLRDPVSGWAGSALLPPAAAPAEVPAPSW